MLCYAIMFKYSFFRLFWYSYFADYGRTYIYIYLKTYKLFKWLVFNRNINLFYN